MASIKRHGDKWRAQVFKGGVRRSKVHSTQKAARAWAAREEMLLDQRAGLSGNLPFSDVLDRYESEVSIHKTSYEWEARRIAWLKRQEFASKAIADLTPEDFATWRDARMGNVGAATISRDMNLISAVLHRARREWRMIDKSPLSDVTRPKQPEARDRRPTEAEMQAMRFVAGGDLTKISGRVYLAFEFACETAMRAGEIAMLSCDNLSYDKRVAHLPVTKNGSARDVPLSSKAVAMLQSLPDQELLFNVTAEQISSNFAKIRKKANVSGLTFHDSRREGTSRLAKKLHVLELAKVTGHKDIKMLMVYFEETAEQLARKLD